MRRAFLFILVLALLLPAGAQANALTVSAARTEATFFAEDVVARGAGTHYRVYSCRRHSARAVSCAFKVTGPRGYRCSGRVRTALVGDSSYETISRATVRGCR